MTKTSVPAVVGALLLALSLAVPVPAAAGLETVTGEVEVLDEDESGEVLEIILVNDDADYYIEPEGQGTALFKLVGRQVTVQGETSVDREGMKTIRVTKILKK